MSRRIRGLALVAALVTACATWSHVSCSPDSPPVGAVLDAIERLVEVHKPKEGAAIRDAAFVCRQDTHLGSEPGGPLTEQKHCAFVIAAFRCAQTQQWPRCLANLEHGSGVTTPDDPGPAFPYSNTWPDIPCGIFTAHEMLDFIQVRLNGPGGPPPGGPLHLKVTQAITKCLGLTCLMPPEPAHCLFVRNAFIEAAKPVPNWAYVASELEHMP